MAHKNFLEISNNINDVLVRMSGNPEYFNAWKEGENPANAFTRNTKLTLRVIFWLIVSRVVRSLPVALLDFFNDMGLPAPTKGALSMKRALIKSKLFEDVNGALVRKLYTDRRAVKTFKGHPVLACDGSRIALPNVVELGEKYGWYTLLGNKLYPAAKACVFQDTLNNITVLGRLVGKDEDARRTFRDCFERANELVGGDSIMVLDRGYFSFLMIFLMMEKGQLFVLKSRNTPWVKDFLASGKKQQTVKIVPGRNTSICSDSQWRQRQDKSLTLRLVRFDHPGGQADALVTDIMDEAQFSAPDIIALYRLRWRVETAYGVYKNDMALELFSSFRIDGVQQDFQAALILFNLVSVIVADSDRLRTKRGGKPKGGQDEAGEQAGKKRRKRKKKTNTHVAVGIVHALCPLIAAEFLKRKLKERVGDDEKYLSRCVTYVIPDRSFARDRKLRKTSGKYFRNTNFAQAV